MQYRFTIACLLATLFLLSLVGQSVFAQGYDMIRITNVNAPQSVGAGQSLTVGITVSYRLQPLAAENLVIGLMPHTEMGNPYPITAISSNCSSSSESICFAQTGDAMGISTGAFTAIFTLAAPNTVGTWRPSVIAEIVVLNMNGGYTGVMSTFQVVAISVT